MGGIVGGLFTGTTFLIEGRPVTSWGVLAGYLGICSALLLVGTWISTEDGSSREHLALVRSWLYLAVKIAAVILLVRYVIVLLESVFPVLKEL